MRHVVWLVLAVLLEADRLPAQQASTLNGRMIAGGQPVANHPVALHRVTAADGRIISVDTTAADGTFQLVLDTAGPPGLNFAGTSYDGQFYIGEFFREAVPSEYVLRVGPGGTPLNLGAAARTQLPPPPRESNTAGTTIIVLTVIGLGGLLLFAARRRRSPLRQLLVEIADLDNRHEITPLPQYDRQRSDLLQRLRESA